ncbi:MAG TPA: hypothetical protein DD827_09675 [Gammaproteobacteria bacterium]|nr:hypothetical protein [Gammaproteobacteria bacterium]
MISKRKIALSLLVGVPLALHGNPLDISGLENITALNPSIQQDLSKERFTRYEMERATHTRSQSSAKFELLQPKAISAASAVAEPLQLQRPQPYSQSFRATVLF